MSQASTPINMGSASNGVYKPTSSLQYSYGANSDGWIGNTEIDMMALATNVPVGTVNQSILKNGTTTIESGAEITPAAEDQTINITEGYNTARTVVVKAASEMDPAVITSGNAFFISGSIALIMSAMLIGAETFTSSLVISAFFANSFLICCVILTSSFMLL